MRLSMFVRSCGFHIFPHMLHFHFCSLVSNVSFFCFRDMVVMGAPLCIMRPRCVFTVVLVWLSFSLCPFHGSGIGGGFLRFFGL